MPDPSTYSKSSCDPNAICLYVFPCPLPASRCKPLFLSHPVKHLSRHSCFVKYNLKTSLSYSPCLAFVAIAIGDMAQYTDSSFLDSMAFSHRIRLLVLSCTLCTCYRR